MHGVTHGGTAAPDSGAPGAETIVESAARRPCRRRWLAPGLSTIELILVVALLGIVAGLVVPRFGPSLLAFEGVGTASSNLVSHLRLARRLAVTERVDHRLLLAPVSPPYTSYAIERDSGGWQSVRGPFALGDSVVCTGDREHRFTSLGSATASTSIVLTGGATSRTVRVLAATGRSWVEP